MIHPLEELLSLKKKTKHTTLPVSLLILASPSIIQFPETKRGSDCSRSSSSKMLFIKVVECLHTQIQRDAAALQLSVLPGMRRRRRKQQGMSDFWKKN